MAEWPISIITLLHILDLIWLKIGTVPTTMKKILFLLFLPAYAQAQFRFSNDQTPEQKKAFEALEVGWVQPEKSLPESFQPIRKIIESDAITNELLARVEKRLLQHGISNVEEIIELCDVEKDKEAVGGVSLQAEVSDIRFHYKDISFPWSKDHGPIIKSSYSFQIVKLPMFDVLLTTERPNICADPSATVRNAYNIFTHELTHFDKMNSFELALVALTLRSFDDYLKYTVQTRGGELDAFKAEMKAENYMLSKLRVLNPWAERDYISESGEVDEIGFLKELTHRYALYYSNGGFQDQIIAYTREMNNSRIEYLKQVMPYLKSISRSDLIEDIDNEISRLQDINSNL